MSDFTLFEKFDEILQDPEAVPKLRELILQLAVQGKLVEQDPKDEPASMLLEKIKTEKEKLIKEGKIKKSKPLPPIKPEEVPYELPEGWEWTKFGLLGIAQTGSTPKTERKEYFGGDIPFIKPAYITFNGIDYYNESLTQKGLLQGRLIKKGSLMMVCIGGSIGKAYFNDRNCSCNQQINTITPLQNISEIFLFYFTASDYFQKQLIKSSKGMATPIINRSKWENIIFPLPPLPEQKRIVARVEELMAICDQLEEQQKHTVEINHELNESLLHHLLESKVQREFENNWNLIQENFGELYNSIENVEKLEQSILQLAVMGKLIEQDPDDEPASVLLEKIQIDKERLIKEKKLRHVNYTYNPIHLEGKNPVIPNSWERIPIGEIFDLKTGATPSTKNKEYWGGEIKWLASGDVNKGEIYNCKGRITKEGLKASNCKILPKNCILIALNGQGKTRGTVAMLRINATCNQSLVAITPINDSLLPEYFLYYLRANYYNIRNITGMKLRRGLNMGILRSIYVSVPPLTEQKRIVARVVELMALTKALKENITAAEGLREELLESAVGEALT